MGGGVGAAGLLGALSGAGIVSLNVGYRAFLAYLFGEAGVTAASGALVGGTAAIIVGGAIIGILALYQRRSRSHEEIEAEDLRLVKERIAKIAQTGARLGELDELENLFSTAFYQPMKL